MQQMLDLHNLAEKTPSDGLPVIEKISSTCSYYHYLCDGVDDRVSRILIIFGDAAVYMHFSRDRLALKDSEYKIQNNNLC